MNIKKLIAFPLSAVIMTASVNLCFGEISEEIYGHNENPSVTLAAEEKLSYSVEGGNIYYTAEGVITDCDERVVSADIPAEINGVKITSIGESAFRFCRSLTSITIPEGVTSIGEGAFEQCGGLTSITIPESVMSIGNLAFCICDSLTSIYVDENNSKYSSIDGVLFNKDKTEILCCPEGFKNKSYTIPEGVTSIAQYAFNCCVNLKSITISEGVTSIGDSAFSCCNGLRSITIPESVTSIGEGAFNGCSGLRSITIPESVTSISNYAFSSCESLTSITIPEGVTSIGNLAFSSCESLTSITIPESVTSIGEGAFYSCSGLTSITIPESVTSIDDRAFKYCSSLTSITIPKGVTSIGEDTFRSCSSLTSITIPEGVTSIGFWAFYGCSSLTSITIPEGATSIGFCAFEYCSSLKSITIPESVTFIDDRAFEYCNSLIIFCYEDSYAKTYAEENVIPYKIITEAPAIPDPSVSPSAITINLDSIQLTKGNKLQLTAELTGAAAGKPIKWESDNPEAASIDQTGLLTAIGKGTAVIKAAAEGNEKISASFTVIVNDEQTDNSSVVFGDLDGDKDLTARDAALLLQKVLDSNFKFPIEK